MLSKSRRIVSGLGLWVAGAGIIAMILLIVAEIVATKLFNRSLPYVLEYSEYLVPIIAFWGAAFALAEKAHVRADILVHRFAERHRRWILLAGYALGLIFLVLVFRQLLTVTLLSIEMKRYSFYPVPSPLGPPQLFASIGLGLFIVQLLLEIAAMVAEIAAGGRKEARR